MLARLVRMSHEASRALPCPLRARSLRGCFVGLRCLASLEFVGGRAGSRRVGDGLLAGVAAVEVDQGGAFAVVAHAVHQLAEAGARVGRQGVSGVPQVVEVDAGQPAAA